MAATPIRNVFSIDVEDYFHVSAYSNVVARGDWETLPTRVDRNTDVLLTLLESAGVKATFFVLGWVADRHPEILRRIVAGGHEIACHGWSHELVYQQDRDQFARETRRAKEVLEDVSGQPVRGYRAASFSITRASLWALDCLTDLGFEYDSSIFPVRHDRYGIPWAPRRPFRYICSNGGSITEFPMPCLPVGGWRMPVGGGGYFRIYPYSLTKAILRRINRREGQPFMFYTHPWEIDADQPVFDAGWLSNFRHRMNLAKAEERIKYLLQDFEFERASDVLRRISPLEIDRHQLSIPASAHAEA